MNNNTEKRVSYVLTYYSQHKVRYSTLKGAEKNAKAYKRHINYKAHKIKDISITKVIETTQTEETKIKTL